MPRRLMSFCIFVEGRISPLVKHLLSFHSESNHKLILGWV